VVPSAGTNGEILLYNHGAYFWIHIAYSYICLLAASIMLIRSALLYNQRNRSRVYLLLIAVLIPWVGNIIYVAGLSPVRGLDITPISFALSAALIAWSIFRLQIFGIIPVARDLIVESTSDGVVVLDNENQILDVNPAAVQLLFHGDESVLGKSLQDSLQDNSEFLDALEHISHGRLELELKLPDQKYLDINITPLSDQKGAVNGRILIMRDITELKKIQFEEHEQRMLASSLSDIASALNCIRDVNEVLDRILVDVSRVVPHDTASIALLDEDNIVTYTRFRSNQDDKLGRVLKRLKLKLDQVYTYKTMYTSHQPLICNDTRKDPNWVPIRNSEWIRSYVGAPIQMADKVIGFINLGAKEPGFFSEKSAEWLQAFANHAALAIENASLFERLEFLAIKDGLTGLNNQRHFEEIANREIQRSIRYHKPLSLIMMDIDHFKLVNDQYGHQAGDQALQLLAKIFTDTLRKMDIISRYGGEEFTILLPETSLESALQVAERLREAIASTPLALAEGEVHLTCSMGVADLQTCPSGLKELINCADQALYIAKRAGRNQIKSFTQ